VKNFTEDFLFTRGDKRNKNLVFLSGAVSWTFWLNRNDLVFNNKIISSPRALIFKLLSLLQHWMITCVCVGGGGGRQGGVGVNC
jgi:hypothetical protein